MANATHPDDLLHQISELRRRLKPGQEKLTPQELARARDTLDDAFNLLQELRADQNTTWRMGANRAIGDKMRDAVGRWESAMNKHRQATEALYQGAEPYLRTIQVGGFAAAFAVWAFTRDHLPPILEVVVALLLITSVSIFAGAELLKARSIVRRIDAHERAASQRFEQLDETIVKVRARATDRWGSPRWRTGLLYATAGPAALALLILAGVFVLALVRELVAAG